MIFSQISQNLAVYVNFLLFEIMDETAVGNAEFFGAGADFNLTEPSKVSFFVPPVSVSIVLGMEDRFFRQS